MKCLWCERDVPQPCKWEEDAAPCLAEQLREAKEALDKERAQTSQG